MGAETRSAQIEDCLATSLARAGQSAEAEKHSRAALEADPKNEVARKALAQLPER